MWNIYIYFFYLFQPAGMVVTSNQLSYCYIKGYKLNSKYKLVKKKKKIIRHQSQPVSNFVWLAGGVFQVDDAHKGWNQNY